MINSNKAIDRTTLKGELYKSIENALKTAFENVYPEYEIEIQYKTERKEKNCRYFYVYFKGSTFDIKGEIPMLKDHLVYVDRFVNSDAIAFSEHSREEFEKENDCKEENMNIIKDAINEIVEEFKDKGTFKYADVAGNRYNINFTMFEHNHIWDGEIDIYHNFNIVPISIKNAKTHANIIRNEFRSLFASRSLESAE